MNTKRKISYFTSQGTGTTVCKDVVYYRENGIFGFYSLADGLNSKKNSETGARAVQKSLADDWEKHPRYYFETEDHVLKKHLVHIICQTLYKLSQLEKNIDEYASTLMILIMDNKRQLCRWIHIGDGVILMRHTGDGFQIISHAHNGITPQYTFTTTNQSLEKYLWVGKIAMEDIKKIFLFTDGAILPFYKERKLTEEGECLLNEGIDVFYQNLRGLSPEDDYSMLEIQVDDYCKKR